MVPFEYRKSKMSEFRMSGIQIPIVVFYLIIEGEKMKCEVISLGWCFCLVFKWSGLQLYVVR